jgi:hypothetical protein
LTGRGILAVLAVVIFSFCAAYADLVLRSRSAYLEGEKYLSWKAHPEQQKGYFEAEFVKTRQGLLADFHSRGLTQDEFDEKLRLAEVVRDQRTAENPLKYAYVWFKNSSDLFSPPESRWTKMSRLKQEEVRRMIE